MKDDYLLIDGYNIIFAWDKLKKTAEYSLEDARNKLINIISDYQGFRKINVIIVFDAHLVKGGKGCIIDYGNLFVVFTKEAETADNYIERTTNIMAGSYNVKVATSDNLEQVIIMGSGAQRMSARDLEDEVKLAKKQVREKIQSQKPIKNNLLMDNLDPETAAWLERLRRQ